MNKIIFLDVDGTIRDFDGVIPESTIKSVKKAQKNGHKVCINTGRPFCQIDKEIMDIGFDGIISCAGSHILYDDEVIYHNTFSTLAYINLCKYLRDKNCILEFQSCKARYVLERDMKRFLEICNNLEEELGEGASGITQIPKQIKMITDITDTEKIMYFSQTLTPEEVGKKWSGFFNVVPISFPVKDVYGGEITPSFINKAEGIKNVINVTGHKIKDVIAIGDSENDLEMLAYAGVGVAMGNGCESAKKIADFVTSSVSEDGIKKALEQLEII